MSRQICKDNPDTRVQCIGSASWRITTKRNQHRASARVHRICNQQQMKSPAAGGSDAFALKVSRQTQAAARFVLGPMTYTLGPAPTLIVKEHATSWSCMAAPYAISNADHVHIPCNLNGWCKQHQASSVTRSLQQRTLTKHARQQRCLA